MKGWKEVFVSDIGRVITGNTPPRKNPELYGNHTIFIKPTDISEEKKYTKYPEECYSDLGFKKYKNSLIPKGSTCVVTIGSIGKKMTKAHIDCFINQAMNAIVPFYEYDEEFVYYVLKYNLQQLKSLDSGTASGRENVSKSSFSSIKVNVPIDKTIQTKIGNILSTYDSLIENNLRRIQLLEELAKLIYKEWFVKFRVKGEQLKVNEETGLPEGWRSRPLNEIADIISGFAFKSVDYVKDGKFKIVTIKNVQDGYFVSNTTDTLLEVPNKVKLKQNLKTGDIILSLTGNVGRSCLVYGENYLLNQRVAKIIPKLEINKGFIYALLRNERTITKLENLSNGAAQQNLSPVNMGNMEIILPNTTMLKEFSNQINPVISLICQLNIENHQLKESRDILLPRLMNGKVKIEGLEEKELTLAAEPNILYNNR